LAMGVSGLFGAYMTEKAERERSLKELEESMITSLKDSMHDEASDFVSVYAALIDGLSPALTAIVSLSPFFLSITGLLTIRNAYPASLILTLIILFFLGLYLGKIAMGNLRKRIFYAVGMVAAGLIVATVVLVLGGG
jgi:predicted membrane protein (TIGR00267 family)